MMVSLPVYDRSGVEVGSYEIDPAELAPRINKQLLHDVVVMYLANRRQGSAKSRNRSEVAGTTKKMYRQKGTGRARAGSRRSPIRRGGGHTFPKRPTDWSYRMPKKAIRLATRMALAARIADREVTLIDELSFPEPKTRDAAAIFNALKLAQVRLLVAIAEYDTNVYKSIRNLAEVSVLPVGDLNALEILRPRRLLMTRAALDAFRAKVNAEKNANAQKRANAGKPAGEGAVAGKAVAEKTPIEEAVTEKTAGAEKTAGEETAAGNAANAENPAS